MFSCATRADQKSSLGRLNGMAQKKKNKRWYYGMDPSPFPQKKRAGLHALYSSPAAAFVRCHEVEQMARLGGSWAVPSQPACRHATPRTQHQELEVREDKGVEKRVLKTLPGLLTRQHEKPVIQQGRKGVTHCGPVLIGKRVGSQVNIGASESLF